jgi:hypothetical protein
VPRSGGLPTPARLEKEERGRKSHQAARENEGIGSRGRDAEAPDDWTDRVGDREGGVKNERTP